MADGSAPLNSCESSQYCGNTSTTVREVQGQRVRMCESCAAEYDEQ